MSQIKAFDPISKENELREESASWNTTNIKDATPEDIPIIDVGPYFKSGSEDALISVASDLQYALENVGFYFLTGHQFPQDLQEESFAQVKAFHQLSLQDKRSLLIDKPDWPVKGCGYLPFKNLKLPARANANQNEAFIIKGDHHISFEDNQWPDRTLLPTFRTTLEHYAQHIENLAKKLLPLYATALNVEQNYFDDAFTHPLYRLRMTHYPAVKKHFDIEGANELPLEYGIAPHVDTTFFTILAQDSAGLCIYSERRGCWLNAPVIENAFIINTGELLKQWTNDKYVSVKHFANNNFSKKSRYSIPFFFNANADYKMTCIPTCCDENNPPKYPPISYMESQGVVQGE